MITDTLYHYKRKISLFFYILQDEETAIIIEPAAALTRPMQIIPHTVTTFNAHPRTPGLNTQPLQAQSPNRPRHLPYETLSAIKTRPRQLATALAQPANAVLTESESAIRAPQAPLVALTVTPHQLMQTDTPNASKKV